MLFRQAHYSDRHKWVYNHEEVSSGFLPASS
jgi:hypothetical protein